METVYTIVAFLPIVAAVLLPFLAAGWALETWWLKLPEHKRQEILRRIGGN